MLRLWYRTSVPWLSIKGVLVSRRLGRLRILRIRRTGSMRYILRMGSRRCMCMQGMWSSIAVGSRRHQVGVVPRISRLHVSLGRMLSCTIQKRPELLRLGSGRRIRI